MMSNSIAAAAAKKRVNNPSMSAMPPTNSMINAAQIHGSAGSNPCSMKGRTYADGPRTTLPHPCTSRVQPTAMRMTGQARGMATS